MLPRSRGGIVRSEQMLLFAGEQEGRRVTSGERRGEERGGEGRRREEKGGEGRRGEDIGGEGRRRDRERKRRRRQAVRSFSRVGHHRSFGGSDFAVGISVVGVGSPTDNFMPCHKQGRKSSQAKSRLQAKPTGGTKANRGSRQGERVGGLARARGSRESGKALC